ncbi:3-dehydrosphinganine reductase [Nematocida displodere]|uniref:3-dehydrosphinganine reductase n=1 Tax=Nematocida displodere TaxID=1805483 RepID=A0A177EBZ4_9MICR|nr:3-dehydrosphinganine reductase [Nematocida displodere]
MHAAVVAATVVLGCLWAWLAKRRRENLYEQKSVLVVGGSSGLGLALAHELKRRGAEVTITSRTKKTLTTLKRKFGFKTAVVDVTSDESVASLSTEYDMVFCCNGLSIPSTVHDLDMSKMYACMDTNFYGVVRVYLHLLHGSSPGCGKRLVLVSSTLGLHSFAGYGAYSPSKAALRSFYESVWMESSQAGLDLSIYYVSTINSPGLEQENQTKPEVTKRIEGSSYGRGADPKNRAETLLNALPAPIVVSDAITRFFLHSTEIHTLADYFTWRVAPLFWFIFQWMTMRKVRNMAGK